MEAGEYGITHGTCFFARRFVVVAVAGLLWMEVVCFGWSGFFLVFQVTKYSNSYTPGAVSVDSVKAFRQPAKLPTENSRPPTPARCTVYSEKYGVIS